MTEENGGKHGRLGPFLLGASHGVLGPGLGSLDEARHADGTPVLLLLPETTVEWQPQPPGASSSPSSL